MNQAQYNVLCKLLTELAERPGNNCDDPIYVMSCDAPADQITVDTELVCNTDTGVYDSYTTTTTNGVPAEPVITPTTISCDPGEPAPDVEQVRVCNPGTGTYHVITSAFAEDGAVTVLSDVDTGQVCGDTEFTIVNECPDSIPVKTCPDEPLAVTIVDEPVPQIDVEITCIDGAIHTITYTDGVETSDIVGGPCDDDTDIDVEYVCQDSTGTIHAVTFIDGVQQDPTVDTGRNCVDCQQTPLQYKQKFQYAGIENTGTRFNESYSIELANSDGTTTVVDVAAAANWGAQMQEWAAAFSAAYPDAIDVGRYWWEWRPAFLPNTGAGTIPPADMDFPAAFGQFIQLTVCPGDVTPIGATIIDSSNPKQIGKALVTATDETDIEYLTICHGCGEGCDTPDVPDCAIPVGEEYPATPEPVCQFESLAGNWCDVVFAAEPDADDETAESNIVITIQQCGTDQTLNYSIFVDDNLEPYEPVGQIVDCETLAAPTVEPPECPPGAVFEQVCIPPNSYGILDNSLWAGGAPSPTPHLQNGKDYEITLTHADGTSTVLPVLSDPYFNSFMAEFTAAMPDCKVLPVCANHTSPKGCNASHVTNLAAYPAYDTPTAPGDVQNNVTNPDQSELWATGWLLDCAGCSSPIVRAEITGSNDPAWVGVAKDIITYEGVEVSAFRAITCDGVFWKDCDGNNIAEPVGGCCAGPCAPDTSSPLDCTIVDCPDECVNGSTYINGRPPASNPWSWGPYAADNLNEFETALEAAGYTVTRFGEKHQICPPFGAFGEDPEALLDNGIGEPETVPVETNINPDFVPDESKCALTTVGKNDDRRDALLESLAGEIVECIKGGSDVSGEPIVHEIQDNQTDYTYSYNQTTLKLQGQSPFNSPDAQPFFDEVIACIEGGGVSEITFTDSNGNQGFFAADTILNNDPAAGLFGGQGDTALTQSGKVVRAVMVCRGDGDEATVRQSQLVSVCGLDEVLEKLCAIENNTSPPIDIIVLDVCDDVDGDPANYVPTFVKYTVEQGQPIVVETFSDAALTTPYVVQGQLVDCATGEPVEEPPAPVTLSNHLIEGCVDDGAGGSVPGFTIVNQDGKPLFDPRPLTDLGFTGDCC